MKSLIYGYGVTGKSFERYLTNRNIPFDIFDENIDQHNKKINLSDYQTIFCSPGIPKDLYESLKQYAEVITDLDIFFKDSLVPFTFLENKESLKKISLNFSDAWVDTTDLSILILD